MGDSSFVNGLSLEAINNTDTLRKHKYIIILNDNDMSISHAVGGVSGVLRNVSVSTFYRKTRNAFKRLMSHTRATRAIYRSVRRTKNWFKKAMIKISESKGKTKKTFPQ